MLEVIQNLRQGEGFLPSSCARTKRILCLNGGWYFLTRESTTPLGPYDSKEEVEQIAADFVAFASVANGEMTSRCYEHLAKAG
ncbi:MAG: DUF6316 family protein [Pseudomonadales bacterium]|nr:DUF6316 family protein [Pseudomonadales bacterium]